MPQKLSMTISKSMNVTHVLRQNTTTNFQINSQVYTYIHSINNSKE